MAERIPPGKNRPDWPQSGDPRHVDFHRQEQVRWLAPYNLARTGLQVLVAQKFAELLDRRELQDAAPDDFIDLSEVGGDVLDELWVDYVADTGDGFNATATVASQLARPTIDLPDGTVTRAGHLLVLGGDQVYPAASPKAYQDRLIGPFRAMLPWTEQPRRLVALPGNHDWYDGLTSFLRTFCQHRPAQADRPERPGRWIGGWKTEQSRSYWAVKLPHGWWLWGIDVQLSTLIDTPQLTSFERIAGNVLADGDRVILCWAKPIWTEATADNVPESYQTLHYFVRKVLSGCGKDVQVRVMLAGDTHHYARYVPDDPAVSQKITAGGGGAYLSATHTLPECIYLPPPEAADMEPPPEPVRHELATAYPDRDTSRGIARRVFGSIYANQGFALIPAALYALIGLLVGWTLTTADRTGIGWAASGAIAATVLAVAVVWAGLWAFASFSSRPPARKSVPLASMHLVLHLAAIVAAVLASRAVGWPPVGASLVAGAVGLLVGPFVAALYLFLAQFAKINVNELFSAIALEDHRCFLRLHVAAGGLTIYPFKIERAARWRFAKQPASEGSLRWFEPDQEPRTELIEGPIPVPKRAAAGAVSERI